MNALRPVSPWQDARFVRTALAAIAVSVALHAALLVHDGSGQGRSQATAHGATQGARPTGIRLLQAPTASALVQAAKRESDQLTQGSGEIAIAPSAGPTPAAAGRSTAERPAADGPSGERGEASHAGYFATAEVDQPAAPVTDWQVPRDELPAGRSLAFSARVFVSLDGRIDRIELVEPQAATPELAMVLDDMHGTVMHPARLQGRAVASVRTIAFLIDVERAR